MRVVRVMGLIVCLTAAWSAASRAIGQIVINELVEDEQDFESTDVTDNREFIELYNAGNSTVDISNYTMHYYLMGTTANPVGSYFSTHDTIPAGTTLASHKYYVIGADSVPNVNQPLGTNIDLFPNLNTIFELRSGPNTTDTLLDAVGIDTFRDPELHTATQEQVDQIAAGKTASATLRGGWWGQVESDDAIAPNVPLSIGRYIDGRDTNHSGYDFAMQPLTPGASNNLPQVTKHNVPNVDAQAVGTPLGSSYASSFVLPRVIDPTVAGGANPNAITASPQGGKAIIAYDETGGGDASYSKELVTKFDIYAFIDPRPLGVTTSDTAPQSEASIYGIGTTDPFFGTPNSAGLLTGNAGGNVGSSANGSTGLGWLIQRRELFNGSVAARTTNTILQLLDMHDSGDGAVGDWTVLQSIDLTGLAEGWHRLSIEYDPATGAVLARYDGQTFNATTLTGLVGNFYVGYRENLPGAGNGTARPPTYDLFVPVGVPGDYNNNGVVDMADYVLWRNGGPLQNEGASTGVVDAADYAFWRAHFGNTSGSGSSLGGGSVPEPGSLGLLLVGLSIAAARRSRWMR